MRRYLPSALALAAIAAGMGCLAGTDAGPSEIFAKDVQLRSMADELERAKKLELSTLDKPYFVQYAASDIDQAGVYASLGGITASRAFRVRQPFVIVRVGDYKFDNTNSIYSAIPRLGLLPLDDDYSVFRAVYWRTTDLVYKSATDQITRKRNALREIADPDKTPDLTPAKAVRMIEPPAALRFDRKSWETSLRQVSARFTLHPALMTSSVSVRGISSTYRLINTEGSLIRIPQTVYELQVRASAIAPDGNRVWDHRSITGLEAGDLPKEGEAAKIADQIAAEVEALAKAPAAEDYSGPVLFEGEAAGQMMAQVLTESVTLRRKPLAPPGGDEKVEVLESVWSAKAGSKVVPDWVSAYDDPLQEKFEGTGLAGHYAVDDEGVPAQRVQLIDHGTFKGFLMSRVPVRNFSGSNGHGRLPGPYAAQQAVIGNLFVEAKDGIPDAQLKLKLLERVKTAGLKYGLIIRRLDFPSTANIVELQSMMRQMQKNGVARTLNAPLLAYRAYPDGHEEIVRGLRFREFSAKDLRDLQAASDHPYAFNYVNNGSRLNFADIGAEATTSSIICPSLLFDSLELSKAENEIGAPPIVPPPPLVPVQQ